eukprot:1745164-Rhodomonas_salina.1
MAIMMRSSFSTVVPAPNVTCVGMLVYAYPGGTSKSFASHPSQVLHAENHGVNVYQGPGYAGTPIRLYWDQQML